MKKNLINKMSKAMAVGVTVGTMLISNSIPVFAAPKEMKDGTVFDAEYYASKYADVVAVYGTDENALFQHYTDYGRAENREAVQTPSISTFDPVYYAEQNPDVVAVYGNGNNNLYQHYLQYGKKEGRKPTANATSTTGTPEQANSKEPIASTQSNEISDAEAIQIFNDFFSNLPQRVPDSVNAFFDADGNMSINQGEFERMLVWAIDNYNITDRTGLTDDERIVMGRAIHEGTFKFPASPYYVTE